jgi:hypothetical protein
MDTKIISISLPKYTIEKEPDYDRLGKIVDNKIANEFSDGRYIIRAISLDEHTDLSLDQLVNKILELGTDKYDPYRKPVAHEDFQAYDYDIQAGYFDIKNGKILDDMDNECRTMFGTTIYNFFLNTPLDRGYSVRIDLLLLYDPKKMVLAKAINANFVKTKPELEQFLYKFTTPSDKRSALLGIVKILR